MSKYDNVDLDPIDENVVLIRACKRKDELLERIKTDKMILGEIDIETWLLLCNELNREEI